MFKKIFLLIALTVLTITSSMAMDPLRIAGQSSSTNIKGVTLDVTIKVYDSANQEIYHVDIPSVYFDNQCVFSFVWNASAITYNPLYNVKIKNTLNGIVLFECRLDKIVNAQSQYGALVDPIEINGSPTAGYVLTSDGVNSYWASVLSSLTTGNLTTTTGAVTITGGVGSVIGAGTTVDIATATTSITGLLTSADWNTFNGKQDALGFTPENVANKVTTISGASTDVQYPSAKLLYDQLLLKANLSDAAFTGAISATTYNGYTLPAYNASAAGDVLASTGVNKTLIWTTQSGSSTPVYAHCYELAVGAAATITANSDIPLSSNGPLQGITHTVGTADVTINTTGVYKVDYGVVISTGVGAELAIFVNGVVAPNARIYFENAQCNYRGSAILSLTAGDVIKLRNNSSVTFYISVSPYIGAEMTITKLN